MKKYLLFLFAMLTGAIGAWADAITVSTDSNGLTTVNCTDDENDEVTVTGDFPTPISYLKIVGPFSTAISDEIADALGDNTNSFTRLDLSEATVVTTTSLSTYSLVGLAKMSYIKHLILPQGASVPTATQLKNNASGSLDNWDNMEYFVIPQSDGSCDIYLTETGLESIAATDIIIKDKSTSTVTVHLAEGEDENPATDATKTKIETYLKTQGYKLNVVPYTVSGCNVSINMDGAEAGQALADLIALAKAAMTKADASQTNICTLTVTGELSANDLTVALSSSNMASATRIDLSGATLASGVSLTSLNIPSSLTSLVLPKDQTVSVGLASKLADATYLMYAYSPSSDCTATGPNQADENKSTYKYDDSKNTIADYVWVNKAGGLAQALENEEQLRNSFYIKVASGVALTATDINFGALTNKPTNYLFLDLSESIMTSTVADSYTVTDNIAYRIILPNNWSNDDLAHFQNNGNKGNLAAVYSYEDTKLNILVINDNSYWGTALQNPRIVRAGTNAIDILPGAYTNNHQFGTATTEGKGIITAINNANESIKSVYISIANTGNNAGTTYTIANSNITYLSFEGIKSAYNGGPTVNVTGCSSLQTLNLKDAILSGVIANGITSLTTVDMTGTTNSGTTNLSGTGLRTFTTNSSTKLQGDINLMSTALTSLNTTAEIGTTTGGTGNILLNGCESLASIDVSGTQFQNTSSMIHIDTSTTENSGNTAIDALKTIQVPTGFTSSTRIHPYDDVKDKIAEAAATGAFELEDGCNIDYNASTGVATVTAKHPGCLEQLMQKDDNYSKFPAGTIFTFNVGTTETPVDCKLNAADLAALAGDATHGNYNKFYVDLYNLPASYTDKGTTYYYDDTKSGEVTTAGIITTAINTLRSNDRQYKGLLLPSTIQNIGTTLIMDGSGINTQLATCSEFIAYSGTVGTSKLTASYIYKAANDWGVDYNQRLLNMKAVMDLHTDIKDNTAYYSVSTNSATPLDLSGLPAATTGGTNTSKLETVNNDMVIGTGTASIYADPAYTGVMKDVMDHTGIGGTLNLEILKVGGSLDATDIASVNSFTSGPRVLNLSEAAVAGGITKAMLESITNANIEYIILPEGMSKDVVCGTSYSSSMTNLKAVISSSATNLVAYVKQAGSLAEARYLTTGGSIYGTPALITPTITGLTSVTLSGNLNASDIFANDTGHKVDNNGHWTTTGSNAKPMALSGEQGTITTIDLNDAIFPTQTDMNFSYAGLSSLRNITLPTSNDMTLIPAECFMGIVAFDDLCIPSNYKKIDNAALMNTYVSHITTTDGNGAVVDNGPLTYTLSKNLEQIGSKPAEADGNGVHALDRTVFPQNRGVTDVYVLAHKVPKCYANAFPANMLYGWGGFQGGDFPYCREKYDNSPGDGSMIFTVLHFPDKTSFNASNDKEDSYEEMEKLYTDINKVYTKKEQTGAVDANGDPIAWPTFAELRRAYNQATAGAQWYDWNIKYDAQGSINGGNYIPVGTDEYTVVASGTATNTGKDYSFAGYEGWHQFVLSMATYVAPDETVVNEKIERTYKQDGYYTFCIPFDMTEDEVIALLGVPASTDNVVNKYVEGEGTTATTTTMSKDAKPKMPAIHTLQQVTRSMNGSAGKITLTLTRNLASDGDGDAPKPVSSSYQYYIPDGEGGGSMDDNTANSKDKREKKIVIRGGYPYIIKPWRLSTKHDNDLGLDVLTRYEFSQVASCVHRKDCYIQLGQSDKATSRFAVPFTGHEVQAVFSDGKSTVPAVYKEGDKTINYKYRFQGQFWEQTLPLNSYYLAKDHKWYYYGVHRDNYVWKKYHSIINVSSVLDEVNSLRFTQKMKSTTEPLLDAKQDEIFEGELKNVYTDGHDDKFTSTSNETRRVIFDIEDGIIEYDGDGNEVSAIEKIDGVDVMPASGKVYDLKGLYVGNSLSDLPKGMYVVNGKKVIVK